MDDNILVNVAWSVCTMRFYPLGGNDNVLFTNNFPEGMPEIVVITSSVFGNALGNRLIVNVHM